MNTRKPCGGEMSTCAEEPGLPGVQPTPSLPPVLCLRPWGHLVSCVRRSQRSRSLVSPSPAPNR